MNRKQLITLLVLLVVLGVVGLVLYQRGQSSWQTASKNIGHKLLGDLPVNDVTHIDIKQGTNELNLVKKDTWRVRERQDYPANYGSISEFLIKVRDLKSVQTEQVGPSQLPRLALVPGSGTNSAVVVDFKDQNDKTLKSLLLGKKHMRKSERSSPYGDMGDEGWPDGRYIKIAGDSGNVAVVSDSLSTIEPKPDQWLNKDFFKIEKPKAIAVTFSTATNSWKLTRETETGEWKLADAKPAEQLDSSKASGVSNPFSSPSFNDVVINAKPEELGLDKPTVLKIDTFDNFSYTVNVGQKTNDTYALTLSVAAQLPKERTPAKDEKPEDKTKLDKDFKDKQQKLEERLNQEKAYEKWVYLVSSWTVDSLLKDRSQLLIEKKEEAKKEEPKNQEPNKVETNSEEAPVIGELPKPADVSTNSPPNAPKQEAK